MYAMRRVNCPDCGVKVENVSETVGKHKSTLSYRVFLATWAKRLSLKETALAFGTSWDTVYRAVHWVVRHGLANRKVGEVEAIGVHEIVYRRGHKYLTLVYQIIADCRRLLHAAKDRTESSLRGFISTIPAASIRGPPFICTDMWRQYMNVIVEQTEDTVQIFDHFHVMKKLGEKIIKIRAEESKELSHAGKGEYSSTRDGAC